MIPKVKELHKISRGTYGKRRMAVELEVATGISCGQHKAGTLMGLAGVQVKRRKKFKVTTNSKHGLPVSPNLLARCFTVPEPDRVYVGDITYIWILLKKAQHADFKRLKSENMVYYASN